VHEEYVIKGRLPWFSTDAMSDYEPSDTDTEVEKEQCFRCRYADCVNCHCHDQSSFLIEQCEELIEQNKNYKEICAILHISKSAFYKYKAVCAIG